MGIGPLLFLCMVLLVPGGVGLAGDHSTSSTRVQLGKNALAESYNGVAIGENARATGYPDVAKGASLETVAIGESALAAGWRCTAIGAKAQAHVVSATAVGRGAYAYGPHMIAIGRGAYMETVQKSSELQLQNACGIAGDSLWLGGIMGHKMIDRTGDSYVHEKEDGGDGKQRWDVRTSKPRTYTIHGMDAYDARFNQDPDRFRADQYRADDPSTWVHRVDKDVPGGGLVVAAGRGTGTADGGVIDLQTAPAGRESLNRKNPLKSGVRIDTDYQTENATPMLLWNNNARKLKRVYVGPPDSGGPGFRALVIAN